MTLPTSETTTTLQQKLWYGQVPVVFSLYAPDVTTLHAPRPFYAMIPRMSYLVTQTRQVIEYFRDAAPPITGLPGNCIWFESQGRALKWHLPCGLLFDMSHPDGASAMLPWHIVVHFSGFPADELLPCENEQAVEMHFMHTLKQATFLRTGTTKVIMGMPEIQQTQIWTSILQNDFATYHTATRDLQLALPSGPSAPASNSVRLLPVRFHLTGEPVVQMPITPYDPDEPKRLRTLQDVVVTLLPDLFDVPAPSPPRVIAHGLSVPLDVPILALYQAFAYPDGYLHLFIPSVNA
ncbi:hypothetical protein Poli38472_004484 [Pythium oligandrum]|uniref:Autophagy protein 5 n=1 Tax=Pythium oligandrum TaxID=41045 RepID=A0A8K1FDH4_PYTOL|nr:hypothetical protein Poli38472_004484 [Pythium oligandrum]|eukprot:TMW59415.1 hypothetical protein Poli38472_004484 [Pythium oligandrum]